MNITGDTRETAITVRLPREPQMRDDLRTFVEEMEKQGICDIVLDFSEVDIVTSASLASLVRLWGLTKAHGCRLLFHNVSTATRRIFEITELSQLFAVAEDE